MCCFFLTSCCVTNPCHCRWLFVHHCGALCSLERSCASHGQCWRHFWLSQLGGGFYCHRKAVRNVVHLSVCCGSVKAVPGHRADVGSCSKSFPKVLAPVAMVPGSERERESSRPCPLGPTSHVFHVSRPRCNSVLAQALSQHPCAPLQR